MHKTSDNLCKRYFVPAFLLIVFAFLVTPAWSDSPGRRGKATPHFGRDGYGGRHEVRQPWVAQRTQRKQMRNYERLSPEEKSQLNGKIQRWNSLPPKEQNELRQRMQQYKKLPSQDRMLYQKRFNQMQELPPGERRKVKEKLRKWDNLSPQEKEELRRKFKTQQGR